MKPNDARVVTSSGRTIFMEDYAVAQMLRDGWLIVTWDDSRADTKEMLVVLHLNDVLVPASDSMSIDNEEDLERLYSYWFECPKWGPVIWAAKKAGIQPWSKTKKRMIEEGVWSDELEELKSSTV